MGTATDNTEWPTSEIRDALRDLINFFFSITESKADDAGDRLAQEVFSPSGMMVTPHGTYNGSAEISPSRKHAWDTLNYRRHEISKVFTGDPEGKDILMLGKLVATTKDGSRSESNFIARIKLETVDGKKRFGLYQAQAWDAGKRSRLE